MFRTVFLHEGVVWGTLSATLRSIDHIVLSNEPCLEKIDPVVLELLSINVSGVAKIVKIWIYSNISGNLKARELIYSSLESTRYKLSNGPGFMLLTLFIPELWRKDCLFTQATKWTTNIYINKLGTWAKRWEQMKS